MATVSGQSLKSFSFGRYNKTKASYTAHFLETVELRKTVFLRTDALHQCNERELVRTMLHGKGSKAEELDQRLGCALVEDMQDGGMGSIRFLATENNHPTCCKALAEAEYTDDRVLVSIVLNGDNCGALSELDFWKVDFSPLSRYPRPSDLRVRQ